MAYTVCVKSRMSSTPIEFETDDLDGVRAVVVRTLGSLWDMFVGDGIVRQEIHRHYDHWLNGIARTLEWPHVIGIESALIVIMKEDGRAVG